MILLLIVTWNEKFACEPVAFHLHKKNDFLSRLSGKATVGKFKDEKAMREIVRQVLGSGKGARNEMDETSFKDRMVKQIRF